MLWLVLGQGITKKRTTASFIGLVQAILVIISGVYGTHGIISLVTYTLPGVMTDVAAFFLDDKMYTPVGFFILGLVANVTGTFLSSLVFFRLPLIPMLLTLSVASLSGGLGGLIAYKILNELNKAMNR